MTIICVFGTSITYGAWDFELGGWVNRLRNFLDKKRSSDQDSYLVYNLGISGDTTADLFDRFEVECKSRALESIEYKEPFIIMVSIGINDSQYIHNKNALRTPEDEFKKNIKKLINLAKRFTPDVIFIGLTPVDESKTTPIPWDTNKSYKNEYIGKFNEIIKSTCKENNTLFVEVFNHFLNMNYKNLIYDGLHPNSKGHELIYKIVKEFLIKNKII